MSNLFNIIQQNKPEYTPLDENEPLLAFYKMGPIITGSAIFIGEVILREYLKARDLVNTERVVWGTIPKLKDVSTGSTGGCNTSIMISKTRKNERKYIEYYNEFLEKWGAVKSEFESCEEVFIIEKFKEVIYELIAFNPEYITFSITEEESIYFQSRIESYNVYFELYFDKSFPNGIQSVINIFKDKKPLLAFNGSINECISEINNQIHRKDWSYSWQECEYEISNPAYSSTEF